MQHATRISYFLQVISRILFFLFFTCSGQGLYASIIVTGEVIDENPCGEGPNGAIDISVSGSNGPLSFNWTNGETTEDISGLSAGFYGVIVSDSSGQMSNIGFFVQITDSLIISDNSIYPTCDGDLGTGIVEVQGGNLPYSFLWSNGSTTSTAVGLDTGMYSVQVTDASGCSKSLEIEISTNPELLGFPIVTHADCYNGFGAVELVVLGGSGVSSVDWNGIDSAMISPGSYQIQITDNTGCEENVSFTILSGDSISVELEIEQENCKDSTVALVPEIEGNGPFTIDWGAITDTARVTGGTYSITVEDSEGCIKEFPFTLDPVIPLSLEISKEMIDCQSIDGLISLNISGGQSPVLIEWNDEVTSSDTFRAPLDSLITLSIVDQRKCRIDTTILFESFRNIAVDFSVIPPSCGLDNGSISLDFENTQNTYLVSLNGATVGNAIAQLGADTFAIEIVEQPSQCVLDTVFILENVGGEIEIDSFDITGNICREDSSGIIVIYSSVDSLSYEWSNGLSGSQISGLPSGNYTVIISDKYNCSIEKTFDIPTGNQLSLSFGVDYDPCEDPEGIVTSNVQGGTPPYTYLWENGEETSSIIVDEPGAHTLEVIDSNGCSASSSVFVQGDPVGGKFCFKIPNAFSPNGDFYNDTFEILGVQLFLIAEFTVFDRWGKQVFQSNRYTNNWDGTANGSPLEHGVYYYTLRLDNTVGKTFNFEGQILLKR